MSFLADLITEVTKDIFIVQLVGTKIKRFLIAFGSFTSIVSALFFSHLYTLPSSSVEDYVTVRISYDVATSNSRDGRIVLRSGSQSYYLPNQFWDGKFKRGFVVEALNRSREATVWLSGADSMEVMGIATKDFTINPSIGAQWQNRNHQLGIWICWIFAFAGLCIIVLAIFVY